MRRFQPAAHARRRTRRLLLLALLSVLPALAATPLRSLDDQDTTLAARLAAPNALALIVSHSDDLPHAQRLLTAAVAEDQPALILIQLPENALQAAAIRRAAARFFRSELSRSRVFYLQQSDNPYPDAKTLLLAPGRNAPLYRSPDFPESLDLLNAPQS